MNDNSKNGKPLYLASFVILITAITVALIHRPTRKRIRKGLVDMIDETDKKMDEVDTRTREIASEAGYKMRKAQTATVQQLQNKLAVLQKELDKLQ